MPDYGLINGFAEAIKQGFSTYQDVKKSREEQAIKDRLLKFQGFKEGIVEDPETGNLDYTPEKKLEKDYEQKLKLGEIQAKGLMPEYDEGNKLKGFIRDPNSPKDSEKALDQFKKQLEIEKLMAERTPKGKYEKLGAEQKQKIGFILSGLQGLSNYENLFRKGGRQSYVTSETPVIGQFISDKPIDQERTRLEEAIGRLASGGAISGTEEARFKKMLPRSGDTDESAARKLLQIRSEFENKLQAYGYEPNQFKDLGFEPQQYGYETGIEKIPGRGLLKPKAPKGSEVNYTPDVLEYAEKYKIDPAQALQIKKSRGG